MLWDTNSALGLVVGDTTGLYVTGPDGLALTQLRFDATQRYYHHDALGSTRALTTADGTIAARSDYDPYGNPTTDPARPASTATRPGLLVPDILGRNYPEMAKGEHRRLLLLICRHERRFVR